MTDTIALTNVSNLAAFGVEWRSETGTMFQLVSTRGTSTLMIGMLPNWPGARWSNIPLVKPERFGFIGPLRNFAELKAIAQNFIASATVQDG